MGVTLVLLIATFLRLYHISEESVFIDEGFTAALTGEDLPLVLNVTASDVHPPLYYLGVYFWRALFGHSDAALRSYSALWSVIGLLAVFLLAGDIGGRRVALFAILIGAVNPLSIYMAQYARMYAQTAALATFASWCLWRWMVVSERSPEWRFVRKWAFAYVLFALATILSHYVAVLILVAQGLFCLIWFRMRRYWMGMATYIGCTLAVVLGFLPWLFHVLRFRSTFYSNALEWMGYPPWEDYFSFLGLEFFWGRLVAEHPRNWLPEMILPVLILVLAFRMLCGPRFDSRQQHDAEPRRAGVAYAAFLLFVPVALAWYLVYAYRPLFYRPSFPIFVLPGFLVLAGVACDSLGQRLDAWFAALAISAAMLTGTLLSYRAQLHTDWRGLAQVWQTEGPPAQITFLPMNMGAGLNRYVDGALPMAAEESLRQTYSWYVDKEIWVCWQAYSPAVRTGKYRDYFEWLTSLGRVRKIWAPKGLGLIGITVGQYSPERLAGRVDRWLEPFDMPGVIGGLDRNPQFDYLEYNDTDLRVFRWSRPKAWFWVRDRNTVSTVVMNVLLPPPAPADYQPELKWYVKRGLNSTGLLDTTPVAETPDYHVGELEVELPVPPGSGRIWIGWKMKGVNLAKHGVSPDERDLGLRLNWLGLLYKDSAGRLKTESSDAASVKTLAPEGAIANAPMK